MLHRNFQSFWRGVKPGSLAAFLDNPWQQIEPRARSLPAELLGFAGEFCILRVAENRSVGLLVAGVAEELVIPNPDSRPLRGGGGENGHQGLDFPAVRSVIQMLEQSSMDMIGIAHIATIADFERGPKETADATGIVAPSHACTVFQLLEFQIPRSRFFDFGKYCFLAGGEVMGAPLLFMRDGVEEILGLAADVGGMGRCHHSMTALA